MKEFTGEVRTPKDPQSTENSSVRCVSVRWNPMHAASHCITYTLKAAQNFFMQRSGMSCSGILKTKPKKATKRTENKQALKTAAVKAWQSMDTCMQQLKAVTFVRQYAARSLRQDHQYRDIKFCVKFRNSPMEILEMLDEHNH